MWRLPQDQRSAPGRPGNVTNVTLDTLAATEFQAIPNALPPFYKAAAVAKLGPSKPPQMTPFVHLPRADPAVASRLARKTSIAWPIAATVLERQLSETRCSRSPLLET